MSMLGKRAQQRYGYAGRHCPCCNIDWAVREHKHSARQTEKRTWREDAWSHHPEQERVEDAEWYARTEAEADPNYELPPGFDGSWSIGPSN